MSNILRYSILSASVIVILAVVFVLIGFLLRLAILAALLAIAYYWFNRAISVKRHRPWR